MNFKQLVDKLVKLGWTYEHRGRHDRLCPPWAPADCVTVSRSPSDHRAVLNIRGDVRRLYRKYNREPEV